MESFKSNFEIKEKMKDGQERVWSVFEPEHTFVIIMLRRRVKAFGKVKKGKNFFEFDHATVRKDLNGR